MKVSVLLLAALLALAACDSTPPKPTTTAPAKKEPKPAELETGRVVFQKAYIAAHTWAPDARPFRLESVANSEATGAGGKATLWRASFASVARRSIKAFTWSGSALPDAPERGISASTEDTFNPSNVETQPFDIAFLKIDSGQAFDVAQKHGGETLLKKDPKQPVLYLLDWAPAKNELKWHVIYGASRNEAKLVIVVDASSGIFIGKEH